MGLGSNKIGAVEAVAHFFACDELDDEGVLHGVDDEAPLTVVDGERTPVNSATESGEDDRSFCGGWCEYAVVPQACYKLAALCAVDRREAPDVVVGE